MKSPREPNMRRYEQFQTEFVSFNGGLPQHGVLHGRGIAGHIRSDPPRYNECGTASCSNAVKLHMCDG